MDIVLIAMLFKAMFEACQNLSTKYTS